MKKRKVLSPVFISLVLVFMYLPVIVVVVFSFNDNPARNPTVFTGFTLNWYGDLFRNTRGYWDALLVSVELAAWSCLLAVVIGTLGAVGMARRLVTGQVGKLGRIAELMTTIPIMIPEIILGLAFMALFYFVKLPMGMTALVLSHATFCIPYVFIIVKGRMAGLDPALSEAARDLGANEHQVFWSIILPLIRPAILSGAILSVAMSLDDFVISVFLAGADTVTLPLKIYSSVRTGVSPQINALCTVILLAAFLAVGLGRLFGRKHHAGQA
jgi:spermidine/putrescine transport system permease protein